MIRSVFKWWPFVVWCIPFIFIGIYLNKESNAHSIKGKKIIKCAQIEYFEPNTKELEKCYSEVTIRDNKVILLSYTNGVYEFKDFVNTPLIKDDKTDVTTKDGLHFKIEIIIDGTCDTDKVMDSIKNSDNYDN